MKTIQVPKFDIYLKFVGYTTVEVKDIMDYDDEQKVIHELPGIPQGYCPALGKILETKQSIEITRFYDSRQRTKLLKGHYITVIENTNMEKIVLDFSFGELEYTKTELVEEINDLIFLKDAFLFLLNPELTSQSFDFPYDREQILTISKEIYNKTPNMNKDFIDKCFSEIR